MNIITAACKVILTGSLFSLEPTGGLQQSLTTVDYAGSLVTTQNNKLIQEPACLLDYIS